MCLVIANQLQGSSVGKSVHMSHGGKIASISWCSISCKCLVITNKLQVSHGWNQLQISRGGKLVCSCLLVAYQFKWPVVATQLQLFRWDKSVPSVSWWKVGCRRQVMTKQLEVLCWQFSLHVPCGTNRKVLSQCSKSVASVTWWQFCRRRLVAKCLVGLNQLQVHHNGKSVKVSCSGKTIVLGDGKSVAVTLTTE